MLAKPGPTAECRFSGYTADNKHADVLRDVHTKIFFGVIMHLTYALQHLCSTVASTSKPS